MTSTIACRLLPLLLALACTSAAHAGGEDRAASIRQNLRIDSYKDVSYIDENKKAITAEQFDEKMRAGGHFSMIKQKKDDEEVKVLLAIETKPRVFAAPKYKIKPGEPFPAFALPGLAGKLVDNRALLGKYTVVSFYFADCAPCIKEVPELNELSQARADLNFVAMSFDPVAVTRKFVAEHKLAWTVLSEARTTLSEVGIQHYPSFALIDAQGKLLAVEPGHSIQKNDKTIAAWVKRLVPAQL